MVVIQTICSTRRRFVICMIAMSVFAIVGTKAVSAWALRSTPEKIAAGEALFTHDWTINDPLCGEGDGLGPVFNETSCVACHSQGGVGGSGGSEGDVLTFQVIPNKDRRRLLNSAVHVHATNSADLETVANVKQVFPTIKNGVELRSGCFTSFKDLEPVIFETLNSPALFGIGLLDDVSNFTISIHGAKRLAGKIQSEVNGDFGGNGVGYARTLPNGAVGKFGWKGQFASVEDFVASACAMEIGLTNSKTAQAIPKQHREDRSAQSDMTWQQLNELVCFVKSLPAPAQVLPENPAARERVIEEEKLFSQVGCTDCHVKDFGSIPGVYTDFHLYSLEDPNTPGGSGYVREEVADEFKIPRSEPMPQDWKTPALWGVADSAPYFHDGGSATLMDAINRHSGQAKHSHTQFKELSNDQQKLVEFLKSLRAPMAL